MPGNDTLPGAPPARGGAPRPATPPARNTQPADRGEFMRAVQQRVERSREIRDAGLRAVLQGRPQDADPLPERRLKRIRERTGVTAGMAERLAAEGAEGLGLDAAQLEAAEELGNLSVNFPGVDFLHGGRTAAEAVVRIVYRDSNQADGTGFMISPTLLLTNHHVIPNGEEARRRSAEFRFERRGTPAVQCALDPETCFVTSGETDLDFTIVALAGGADPGPFTPCVLPDGDDDDRILDFANVIHHPNGRAKELLIRDNRLVPREKEFARVLHYLAPTDDRSSGAPVFNDEWEVIALHHGRHDSQSDACEAGRVVRLPVNEGTRVPPIIAEVVRQHTTCTPRARELLREALGDRITLA